MRVASGVFVVAVLAMAGCGGSGRDGVDSTAPSTGAVESTSAPTTSSAPTGTRTRVVLEAGGPVTADDLTLQAVIERLRLRRLGVAGTVGVVGSQIIVNLPGVDAADPMLDTLVVPLTAEVRPIASRRVYGIGPLPPDLLTPLLSLLPDEPAVLGAFRDAVGVQTAYTVGPAQLVGRFLSDAQAVVDPVTNTWQLVVTIARGKAGQYPWGVISAQCAVKLAQCADGSIGIAIDGFIVATPAPAPPPKDPKKTTKTTKTTRPTKTPKTTKKDPVAGPEATVATNLTEEQANLLASLLRWAMTGAPTFVRAA
jgi:hypothetical protein